MLKIKRIDIGHNALVTIVGNTHIAPPKEWKRIEKIFEDCSIILCEGIIDSKDQFMVPIERVSIRNTNIDDLYEKLAKRIGYVDQRTFYNKCHDTRYRCCDCTVDEINNNVEMKKAIDVLDKMDSSDFDRIPTWLLRLSIKFASIINMLLKNSKNDSSIIDLRNEIVIEAVKWKLRCDHRRIGVLYGGAHVPGLVTGIKNITL